MYIGGAGAILIGVGSIMYDWYVGEYQSVEFYVKWLILGITIIGGRSVAEKVIRELKEMLSKE